MNKSFHSREITLLQPKRIVFGKGCTSQCAGDLLSLGLKRVFIVTAPPLLMLIHPLVETWEALGVSCTIYSKIITEPTVSVFEDTLEAARMAAPDAVLGIGGGSVLDTAKLVAALYGSNQTIREVFGREKLSPRRLYLACLPTTSGTGSEVSPNAIFLDETDKQKKAVISSYLVADATYIDPLLTALMPPSLTASTGFDALAHCIEAYANKFAHPLVDGYALQGIRLISTSLKRACEQGDDLDARARMAMGSLYGGLCLAPVNTAAVHALAYPLGEDFHVGHGLAIALLLPHVLEFNLPSAVERYAAIALALGAEPGENALETARNGVALLRTLLRDCGIRDGLSTLGIPENAIPDMARSAMNVTRLLKNNPREISREDAEQIYRTAF